MLVFILFGRFFYRAFLLDSNFVKPFLFDGFFDFHGYASSHVHVFAVFQVSVWRGADADIGSSDDSGGDFECVDFQVVCDDCFEAEGSDDAGWGEFLGFFVDVVAHSHDFG